jgi:hypothetical protein
MRDLNQISAKSSITLISANAINNKGHIIASGVDRRKPCAGDSKECPIDECAPVPKYFLLLTPVKLSP